MDLLQRIHALLEIEILVRELGLEKDTYKRKS
jgi:hypothetical protein